MIPGFDKGSGGRHPHSLGHSNLADRYRKRSARGLCNQRGEDKAQMHRGWSQYSQAPHSLCGWEVAGLRTQRV